MSLPSLFLFLTLLQPNGAGWVQWHSSRPERAHQSKSKRLTVLPVVVSRLQRRSARTRDRTLHVRMCVHALFSISLSRSRAFSAVLGGTTAGFQIDNTHVFIIDVPPLDVGRLIIQIRGGERNRVTQEAFLEQRRREVLPRRRREHCAARHCLQPHLHTCTQNHPLSRAKLRSSSSGRSSGFLRSGSSASFSVISDCADGLMVPRASLSAVVVYTICTVGVNFPFHPSCRAAHTHTLVGWMARRTVGRGLELIVNVFLLLTFPCRRHGGALANCLIIFAIGSGHSSST